MSANTIGTYYYKDKHARLYVLIINGRRVGEVKTKREADAWFRQNGQQS